MTLLGALSAQLVALALRVQGAPGAQDAGPPPVALAEAPAAVVTPPAHSKLPDWVIPEALEGYVQDTWSLSVAILVVAVILAKLLDWIVTGLVRRATRKTQTSVDDQLLEVLHGPIVRTVLLGGVWLVCLVLEEDGEPVPWLHRLIVTLVVLVWTLAVARAVNTVLAAMAGKPSRFHAVDERTLPLFNNLGKVFVLGVAVYLVIEVWKLDATGWLASAGVAGIALGFAAKDTLANLFAGVFIIADAPYRVGDYVDLDSGYRGRVQHIGLRSTRILTRDDIEITVPNSVIGGGAIVNESSGAPRYRVRVKVGVAYGSDIEQVRRVLLEVPQAADDVIPSPAPRVRFRAFGESALEFELLAWIEHPEWRGRTLDKLNCEVYRRFAEAGIEVAFPQRDLHVRSLPAGWRTGGDED